MAAKAVFEIEHPQYVQALFHTDKYVVATTLAGPTKVLNVCGSGDDFGSSGLPRTLELGWAWCHVVYGDTIAVGNEDSVVRTWDLGSG